MEESVICLDSSDEEDNDQTQSTIPDNEKRLLDNQPCKIKSTTSPLNGPSPLQNNLSKLSRRSDLVVKPILSPSLNTPKPQNDTDLPNLANIKKISPNSFNSKPNKTTARMNTIPKISPINLNRFKVHNVNGNNLPKSKLINKIQVKSLKDLQSKNTQSIKDENIMHLPVLSDVRSLAPKPTTPKFSFNLSEVTIKLQNNKSPVPITPAALDDRLTINKRVNTKTVRKKITNPNKMQTVAKRETVKNQPNSVLTELPIEYEPNCLKENNNPETLNAKNVLNYLLNNILSTDSSRTLLNLLLKPNTNSTSGNGETAPPPEVINAILNYSESIKNTPEKIEDNQLSNSVNLNTAEHSETVKKCTNSPPNIITDVNTSKTDNTPIPSSSKNSEPESDENSIEINDTYQNFINLCFKIENTEDMKKIVNKMKKYYMKAPADFVNSECFRQLVEKEIKCASQNPGNLYFIIGELLEELKVRRIYSKEDSEDVIDLEKDEEIRKKEKKLNIQIKRLEYSMKKYNLKIKELDEKEVDLEDEDHDSPYILVDKYKARLLKIYKKVCELTGERNELNNIRGDLSKISLCNDRMPRLCRAVVKIAEKKRNWFPDFLEIYKCVQACAKKDNIAVDEKEIDALARQAFVEIGSVLKKRRLTEQLNDLALMVGSTEDPADKDEELAAKLEESRKTFIQKEKEVFSFFVQKELDSKIKNKINNQDEKENVTKIIPESVKITETPPRTENIVDIPVIDTQNTETSKPEEEVQPSDDKESSEDKTNEKQTLNFNKPISNLEPEKVDEDVISIGDEISDEDEEDDDDEDADETDAESENDSDVLIIDDAIDPSDSELSGIEFSSDVDEEIEEESDETEKVENSVNPKKRTISVSSDEEPDKKARTDSSSHDSC